MDDQIQEKENALAIQQRQQKLQLGINEMIVPSDQEQQLMEQFPFNGEEQPSSVLQLATLPSVFYPFRLLETHPNLQDFTLQYPGFGSVDGTTSTAVSPININAWNRSYQRI